MCAVHPASTVRLAAIALIVLAATGCGFSTQPVEPLVAGGQRFFILDWQATQRGGQPLVQGHVKNNWGLTAQNVMLLVEGVEPPDRIASQRLVSIGGQLNPGTSAYFQTPIAPAPTYRVRMFSFDWVQSPEMHGR
jgi:hypothetical protein